MHGRFDHPPSMESKEPKKKAPAKSRSDAGGLHEVFASSATTAMR